MKIWLLTHSEELKKASGTGTIVKKVLGEQCEVIVWQRKAPHTSILNLSPADTILVYQHSNDCPTVTTETLHTINNAIILDGTWQQAQKMYNRSPYLSQFAHYEVTHLKSVYKKRRNQIENGLCTAEMVIHLLNQTDNPVSSTLLHEFHVFNQ